MHILIIYYSKTGNTEKLALEIAEGVRQHEGAVPVVKSVDDVTEEDFISCDGLIAGSPVYFGTMAAQLKEIFDRFVVVRKKMEGKVGAAFATAGSPSGGKETTVFSIIQAMLIYGMIIAGDPMEATGHYGVCSVGAPDPAGCSHARLLGRRVAVIADKLKK